MPRRRRTSKHRGAPIDLPQLLELLMGASGQCFHDLRPDGDCPDEFLCVSKFDDDEAREAAYWAHRDELVVERCEAGSFAGTRPWAWWRYERAADRPPPDRERAALEGLGVMGPREVAVLRRRDANSRIEGDA